MAFKVVSVKLYQPWHDKIALAVYCTAWNVVAFFNSGDLSVDNDNLSGDHIFGQNKAGIGKMQHL